MLGAWNMRCATQRPVSESRSTSMTRPFVPGVTGVPHVVHNTLMPLNVRSGRTLRSVTIKRAGAS